MATSCLVILSKRGGLLSKSDWWPLEQRDIYTRFSQKTGHLQIFEILPSCGSEMFCSIIFPL